MNETATQATETADTPVFAPAPAPAPVADPLAKVITETKAFLGRYPVLPAYPTRIGNTSGGTTEETPIWGRSKTHPDGAPKRLAIPPNADRIGLEWNSDRTKVLIRVHSYWNEGGWQETYITPEGQVVGGLTDSGFPRQDYENRTPENQWQFGTGFWVDVDDQSKWSNGGATDYRENLPFKVLKQGKDSGYPGYSWTSGPEGLVIKTPKATLYGLVGFETAVFDPTNGNLAFTLYDSFVLNWSNKGNGKEVKSFASSLDAKKYPTDPRRTPRILTHPGPIGAFRKNGELYVVSGEGEILLHRWDSRNRKLIPVAAAYVRPDGFLMPDGVTFAIPNPPQMQWGQGASIEAGKDGNFTGKNWKVFAATNPVSLWNGYLYDVDPDGNLLFLTRWSGPVNRTDAAIWPLVSENGALNPDNLKTLVLPDALKTADKCEQIRVDWETGDLVALVNRGSGSNALAHSGWMLERYPSWYKSTDKASVKAAYSVGPVALGIRSQYPYWAHYNKELGVSPDPVAGAPSAGFGSMKTLGGLIFIAEAQAGGVRVQRLSDGAIVGRMADRLHQNSSFDNPTQMSVTQTVTEFRVSLLDFHGNSVLVWRVLKKDLAAGVKRAAKLTVTQ